MVRIGVSSEYFYQRNVDDATFSIQMEFKLKKAIDIRSLKTATSRAIELYPELCFRPVLKDGKVVAEPNDKEVCVYDNRDVSRCFGSDETNGYLFYFSHDDRTLVLHFYHGMTDIKGIMAFLRTVFYYYNDCLDGLPKDDPFFSTCRIDKDNLSGLDEDDMYDPYRKYADMSSVSPVVLPGPAFQIPEVPDDSTEHYSHKYRISLSTSEYLKKTKEIGASFATLFHILVCDATDRAYGIGDDLFIGMLPADMRSYFGSDTYVNFSDSIMLPQTAEDRKHDISTRSGKIKDHIHGCLNTEYFSALLADKVRSVESFVPTPDAVKPKKIVTPFTLGISVPGRIELGGGLDEMIEDFYIPSSSRVPIVSETSFMDHMTFYINMKNDNNTLPLAFKDELESYGLSCKLFDEGKIYTDIVCMDKLKRI